MILPKTSQYPVVQLGLAFPLLFQTVFLPSFSFHFLCSSSCDSHVLIFFLWLLSRNIVSHFILDFLIWVFYTWSFEPIFISCTDFSSFRLLNSSWILVLFLLKDSLLFFLCFYYHSVVTGKIFPHPTISFSPSYPSQQICFESYVLKICALLSLPN